ncbi:MAG TPA: hypothetical protein VGM37_19320 [Armatimonadota bacterium]|jgi:phage tail tape-measure protein
MEEGERTPESGETGASDSGAAVIGAIVGAVVGAAIGGAVGHAVGAADRSEAPAPEDEAEPEMAMDVGGLEGNDPTLP